MKVKCFLIAAIFLSFISLVNVFCENTMHGVINSDCEYYLNYSRMPSGRLLGGQGIRILDDFYSVEKEDGGFSIYVDVETLDGSVTGYVDESFITFRNNELHNLWCKNILLTRHYYYTGTIEDIYKNDYLPLLEEGVGNRRCSGYQIYKT